MLNSETILIPENTNIVYKDCLFRIPYYCNLRIDIDYDTREPDIIRWIITMLIMKGKLYPCRYDEEGKIYSCIKKLDWDESVKFKLKRIGILLNLSHMTVCNDHTEYPAKIEIEVT